MKNNKTQILGIICLVLLGIGSWQVLAWDARNSKTVLMDKKFDGEVVDVDVVDRDSSTGYIWTIKLDNGYSVKYHSDKISIGSKVEVVFHGTYTMSPLMSGYRNHSMEAFYVPEG